MGYHDGEIGFEKWMVQQNGGGFGAFGAELEIGANGNITMKNALLMRGAQGASRLFDDPCHALKIHSFRPDLAAQIDAFNILHDDVRTSISHLS